MDAQYWIVCDWSMDMRYRDAGKNKENGVVYTPEDMANYVAAEICRYGLKPIQSEIAILDPAVGTGELLVAMIKATEKRNIKIKAVGYETDASIGKETQKKLENMFPQVEIEIRTGDFLDAVENGTAGKYDCVIANPPYIRTQVMGSSRAQEIAKKLSLSGRVDIYYAFLVYTRDVLKPSGIAGYITSNKFMTIKAGKTVRNYMMENYALHRITDLGDTKLFSASVLPCIMIFSLGHTLDAETVEFTSVYREGNVDPCQNIENIFDAIHADPPCSFLRLRKVPKGKCPNRKRFFGYSKWTGFFFQTLRKHSRSCPCQF